MALVAWIRTRPFALSAAESVAEALSRSEIRSRVAPELPRNIAPAKAPAEVEARVDDWIARHPAEFTASKTALAARFRADLSYEGPSGQTFPYLGDTDSYTWLREARNYVRTGTTCDAVVDGECRDTYTMAPNGARMIYSRSLHIAAIVGLHELIRPWKPDFPLPASAMLVPVIIGMLGVLPAFFIGRRLAGTVGGVSAALTSALHPTLLTRSIGSDNDVWNVVLPLFVVWAAMAALDAGSAARRVGYAVLAGVFVGLHSATWSGWHFTYSVLVAALAGALLVHFMRRWIATPSGRVEATRSLGSTGLALAAVVVASAAFTNLAGAEQSSFNAPFAALRSFIGNGSADEVNGASDPGVWPGLLDTTREARPTDLRRVVESVGGIPCFLGGLAGLLVLASDFLRRGRDAALIVIVWFLAALYLSGKAERLLLLLGPPFALSLGTVAGRLCAWANDRTRRAVPRYRSIHLAVPWTIAAVVLASPIARGYATSREFVPLINDAWWQTLTNLHDHAAPDAIVNTAWDYGYWVKYVAERRVSADGASLRTHVPYWLDRALVSPSEQESVGLLRMLNCGSDATPFPEGRLGAYQKVLAKLPDVRTAQATVVALASLEDDQAAALLAERGFTAAERADILRSTHCVPPQSYLIISSAQAFTAPTWFRVGLWDFSKAHAADRTKSPVYTPRYASPDWLSCSSAANTAVTHCPVNMVDAATGIVLREFVFDRTMPQTSRLRFSTGEATPGALLIAAARGLMDVDLPASARPDVGVLLDTQRQRILVGPPAFLRSTFVHLLYLDGRYATHYRKADDRQGPLGERVITWEIGWK
jgi:asparagine N-glycosylation enzyme membrane subunit Stt3